MREIRSYYIPEGSHRDQLLARKATDDLALMDRGLTFDDVEMTDMGFDGESYLSIMRVKSFLWLRRWFRGVK